MEITTLVGRIDCVDAGAFSRRIVHDGHIDQRERLAAEDSAAASLRWRCRAAARRRDCL
jgi:hypothetical protein